MYRKVKKCGNVHWFVRKCHFPVNTSPLIFFPFLKFFFRLSETACTILLVLSISLLGAVFGFTIAICSKCCWLTPARTPAVSPHIPSQDTQVRLSSTSVTVHTVHVHSPSCFPVVCLLYLPHVHSWPKAAIIWEGSVSNLLKAYMRASTVRL